jgi:ABC-type Fe3+-hydroxamate transport system substrate-binding protein
MQIFTDQMGRSVSMPVIPPIRIVSVVPSQTELLHYLGVEAQVVGITKFCIHPQDWFNKKQRVGGTKQLDIATITSLEPDLIIANKEENVQLQIDDLAVHCPVWISDVSDMASAFEMIKVIGTITGKEQAAISLIDAITIAFKRIEKPQLAIPAAYLIWNEPFMTIGGDTFINDMLQHCGLYNVFENETRYPVVSLDTLADKGVELILLSSEPFPFKAKHADFIKCFFKAAGKKVPAILMVDGEMFSWYGSRMLQAGQYFFELMQYIQAKSDQKDVYI